MHFRGLWTATHRQHAAVLHNLLTGVSLRGWMPLTQNLAQRHCPGALSEAGCLVERRRKERKREANVQNPLAQLSSLPHSLLGR